MKVSRTYLIIIFGLFIRSALGQSVWKEYRSCSSAVDNAFILELYSNHTYRYLHWSSFYGTSTLDSGNYVLRRNTIKLQSRFKVSVDQTTIPTEVRYKSKLLIACDSTHFLQNQSLFGKVYLEILKEKF